jgi:broad specificity phosphatase PhoE
MATKRLFLIRHAESANNVDKREAKRTLKGELSWSIMGHVLNLAKIDMDSPLTERGKDMARIQRGKLDPNAFVAAEGVELCLHSSLQRAKETAYIMFGETPLIMREHPRLHEKSLTEYLYTDLETRVEAFKHELLQLEAKTIVLVGHHGFFRRFTGTRLQNCEVVECVLQENGSVTDVKTRFKGGDSLA